MSQESRIEVINRDGWRKEYPLQKGIIYIGSAPNNDIVLAGTHGTGVAALHAQLIASAGSDTPYKLVNLSDSEIALGSGGDNVIPPRAVVGLPDGATLRLGEFTLVFREGSGSYGGFNNGSGSRNIGLRLALPSTQLAPNQVLEGRATIRNLGGKTGAHFEVDLEGLDEDCFEIEPGPLLSSGAEKDVSFRIYHRGVKPVAGEWTFVVRATAPNAYPGEQAEVFQHLNVLPLYRQQLQLLPGKDIRVTSPRSGQADPPASRTGSSRPAGKSEPPPASESQEEWWGGTEEAGTPPTSQAREVRRLKARAAVTEEVDPVKVAGTMTPLAAAEAAEPGEEWAVKVETRPVRVTPVPPPSPPAPVVPEVAAEEDEIIEVEAKPLPVVEEPSSLPPVIIEPEIKPFQAVEPAPPPEVLGAEVGQAQTPEPPPEGLSPEPGWLGRMKQLWPFSGRKGERASPLATNEIDPPYSEPGPVQPPYPQAERAEAIVPEEEQPDSTPAAEERFEEVQVETVPAESILEKEAVEEVPEVPVEVAMEEERAFHPEAEAAGFYEEEEVAKPGPSAVTAEVEKDWWLDEVEPVTPVEPSAEGVDSPEATETQPEEIISEEEPDDWWAEIGPQPRSRTEEQIIRLKAAPPPQTEPPEEEEPAEAEMWWTADVEVRPGEQSNKKS